MSTPARIQTAGATGAAHIEAAVPYFPLQGRKLLGGRLQSLSFPSIAFSLLPFVLSLTIFGSQPVGRTYGPSHWFATYQHGFLRRALVGQLFSGIAFLSWRTIHFAEIAIFVLVCSLTALAFRSILFGTLPERRFAAFLLAAPAFLPHMAYMEGELDNFLYLALLLGAFALMRLGNRLGLLIATACAVIGLLVHEGFALMFYPLILVLAADLVHRRRLQASWVAVHLFVVVAAFAAIIHFGKLPGTPSQWVADAQLRTNMPVDGTVFLVLQSSMRDQLDFVRRLYTPRVLESILLTLALSIPYAIVLWRLMRAACISRGYSAAHTRCMLAVFVAPMALSLLGHDVMRWTSAMCINISLYLLFVYLYPAGPEAASPLQTSNSDLHQSNLRHSLTAWTSAPAFAATLLYVVALGPWGIASNRLLSNLGSLLGR